ncbi:dTDP-4-dehydro-6-deoxyglucose aminotransferase [Desulfosarcina widdelii]|uniref:dTDP-4-dehydro-6-deoxyglucose aminotransferase n=1 Tax=Desulfosarcina widdelii TaxID=947919 RepID=A0A5K7YZD6_9BACT|nr:aminotransferase class I/II-fold pyridoxal phosphate-dependent enzyme [Desulfosarcina widdelii]BBO73750.1 dTDP-4-dehydro-6-deoxyglucose aminotransferase [Desulfosarcina widdelii]
MKQKVEDLAIFGGEPVFTQVRPRGQLDAGSPATFFKYVKDSFLNRRITNFGPNVRLLEKKLCEYHNVEFCVTFCNACIATLALIEACLQIRKGKNVIIPAFTYAGLPHLPIWNNLTPVFCDSDLETHTIDIEAIRRSVNSDTVAIIGVHQVNSPCAINEIEEIAGERQIPLIFDAVYGVHCTYHGKRIGGFGNAEIFSLHATKLINGFEGGYITTNDPGLARKLHKISTFGFASKDKISCFGLNGKLNEIHAALALASLEKVEGVVQQNKHRYDLYRDYFKDMTGCSILQYRDGAQYNYSFVIFEVDSAWRLSRDEICQICTKENAYVKPYYSLPLHLSHQIPMIKDRPALPNTERLSKRFVSMPVGRFVDEETIRRIADLFRFIKDNDGEISEKL